MQGPGYNGSTFGSANYFFLVVGMSAWIAQDKPKRVDERFENLPPLETIHPDELKNYTRQQLSWYLEQRGWF